MTTYKKGQIAQVFMKMVNGDGWVKGKVLDQRPNGQVKMKLSILDQTLELWFNQDEVKKA